MKLKQWLYGAATLTMMAACSDKDIAPDLGGAPTEEGQGYIGIKIQMPTVTSTRANDNFDDGVASEYRINDAIILLFQGESQNTATFTGAFNLKNSSTDDTDDDPNQITITSTRVANVSGLENNGNLYALVMINGFNHKLYSQKEPAADWMWVWEEKEGKKEKVRGKTIQEFQEEVRKECLYSQEIDGFGYASDIFMTNSPLADKQGGANDPGAISNALPVLVQLDKTTYPTESQAVENPAGIIHVERAVGKVTCSSFNTQTDVTVNVGGYNYTLEVDQIWWDIAQNMGESYIVRNTNRKPLNQPEGANMWIWSLASDYAQANVKYRMLGHEALASKDAITKADKIYYRPYFCQAPGYSKLPSERNFIKTSMEPSDAVKWTSTPDKETKTMVGPGAFYPNENTFPVKYMNYANTTRIGFWVTFKFNGEAGAPVLNMNDVNLYISGMDKSTIYLDDEKGYDPLKSHAYAELSDKNKYSALWGAIIDALDKEEAGEVTDLDIRNLVDIDMVKTNLDGEVEIEKISFKALDIINKEYDNHFSKLPAFNFTKDLVASLNNLGNYYKYEAGKVFYEVRIKHFGDDLTPWVNNSVAATTILESYGPEESQNRNYLGRYGIVRNNWYDIVVDKITKLGHPTDPELWDENWPGKPDDNKDQYIAVELRVLSWAKRSQNVIF